MFLKHNDVNQYFHALNSPRLDSSSFILLSLAIIEKNSVVQSLKMTKKMFLKVI